ncbi:MAG: sugar-binding transcriptional regulator [Acidimicrobiales bacterium]
MPMDALARQIRLAEAAQRYYVDGWPQDRLAAHLRTSRSNVSRLLETARREGTVRFVIDHPLRRHEALEAALTHRFGVREARVVAADGLDLVGRLAAAWLVEHDLDGRRLAIGWGRTIEAMVARVLVDQPFDVEVVQVGGDLTMAPAPSGHELVRRLGDALGGRHRFLHAPALVGNERVARELLAEPRIAAELDLARRADVAVLGIGIPGVGFAEKALAESMPALDGSAAAVVCARLIDARGVELSTPLRDRVIAITIDDLARIPTVAGVAASADKGRPIAAALHSRAIDVIVCDQPAAAAAIEANEEQDHAQA